MTTPTRLAEIAERLGKLPYQEYRHSPEEAGQVEGHYVDPCDGEERWLHAASFSGCVDEWAGNSEFFVQATKDIPWLLAQLTAAQARSREDAEIMREAADCLSMSRALAHQNIRECEACGKRYDAFCFVAHEPDCLVTRLRARADELEGRTDG